MIFSYPFFNYPYYRRYRPYPYVPKPNASFPTAEMHSHSEKEKKKEKKNTSTNKSFSNSAFDQENRGDFFDIFGIRLYFDDILLICLIFFLYKEGVEDQSLFISLILLLLS